MHDTSHGDPRHSLLSTANYTSVASQEYSSDASPWPMEELLSSTSMREPAETTPAVAPSWPKLYELGSTGLQPCATPRTSSRNATRVNDSRTNRTHLARNSGQSYWPGPSRNGDSTWSASSPSPHEEVTLPPGGSRQVHQVDRSHASDQSIGA